MTDGVQAAMSDVPEEITRVIAQALRSFYTEDPDEILPPVAQMTLEQMTEAVGRALIEKGQHVWARCPGGVLQTDPMMGYPPRAEHYVMWPITFPLGGSDE